jgi:hypothetical protein
VRRSCITGIWNSTAQYLCPTHLFKLSKSVVP